MFCRTCGQPNPDFATHCTSCGRPLQELASAQVAIPNYLAQSILVTVFCCVPLGIPAIVFAAQVNGKIAAGDLAGAKKASDNAKLFCWLSFGLGLGGGLIYLLVVAGSAMGH